MLPGWLEPVRERLEKVLPKIVYNIPKKVIKNND
jgi:hypothetical protein